MESYFTFRIITTKSCNSQYYLAELNINQFIKYNNVYWE